MNRKQPKTKAKRKKVRTYVVARERDPGSNHWYFLGVGFKGMKPGRWESCWLYPSFRQELRGFCSELWERVTGIKLHPGEAVEVTIDIKRVGKKFVKMIGEKA